MEKIGNALRSAAGIDQRAATVEIATGERFTVNPLFPISLDGSTVFLINGNELAASLVRRIFAGNGTLIFGIPQWMEGR